MRVSRQENDVMSTNSGDSKRVGWLRGVVFDCVDYKAQATFWSQVLDVGIYKDMPGWRELAAGQGGVVMGFQPADNARVQGGLRLDIEVEDLDDGQAAMEAHGASLVQVVRYSEDEEHRIMADPEGNEFTLVLPFPEDW